MKFYCDAGFRILTPADNLPLTQDGFTRMCQAVDHALLARSEAVELRASLDTCAFDAPANFWSKGFLAHNFAKIAAKDYRTFSHLRFYCYNFSGRRLLENRAADGVPMLDALPADLDRVVFENYRPSEKLLRNYAAAAQGVPGKDLVRPPALLGEVGLIRDDVIVNLDTIHYQTSMNGLLASGIVERLRRKATAGTGALVMEIGAGFGALAYHLLSQTPGIRYFIVDLPESIAYSAAYLSAACPDLRQKILSRKDVRASWLSDGHDVVFIPNHLLQELPDIDARMDVVINVMSLSEMSGDQVRGYAEFVSRALAPAGVFYEQNHVSHASHVDIAPILKAKLPCRRRVKDIAGSSPGLSGLYLDPHADMSLWSARPIEEWGLS